MSNNKFKILIVEDEPTICSHTFFSRHPSTRISITSSLIICSIIISYHTY